MIQLQRIYRNNDAASDNAFDGSHIRSYEEYLEMAKIPPCEGVSARVMDALQQRVGHAELSIDKIAEDINLSKGRCSAACNSSKPILPSCGITCVFIMQSNT